MVIRRKTKRGAHEERRVAKARAPMASRNGLHRYATVGGVSFTDDGRGNLTSDGSRTFAYGPKTPAT